MICKNPFPMDHVCSGLWYIWVWILGVLGFGYLGVSLMVNNNPFAMDQVCVTFTFGGGGVGI